MVNKNLVLDVSVILDLWLGRHDVEIVEGLMDRASAVGARLWVSAASLPTLNYLAHRALKQAGMPPQEARQAVSEAMESLLYRARVLTNYGYDQAETYRQARDFEDAQIAASTSVLVGGETRIVTRDANFDALEFASTATPQAALAWLSEQHGDAQQMADIDFIDLKTQQDILRPELERNIQRVLRHGKYIMGPEIVELEERLTESTGSKHCAGNFHSSRDLRVCE